MTCKHEEAELEVAKCGYITLLCECSTPLAEFRTFCSCERVFPNDFTRFGEIEEPEAWALYLRLKEQQDKESATMSVEENYEGALIISDLVDGYLVTKKYYGYTKREAVALFKKESK
jgi:hypothetical protein